MPSETIATLYLISQSHLRNKHCNPPPPQPQFVLFYWPHCAHILRTATYLSYQILKLQRKERRPLVLPRTSSYLCEIKYNFEGRARVFISSASGAIWMQMKVYLWASSAAASALGPLHRVDAGSVAEAVVNLRPTVSRPVCLGIGLPWPDFCFLPDNCGFLDVRRPLWRDIWLLWFQDTYATYITVEQRR
jgi:hypothetical protein